MFKPSISSLPLRNMRRAASTVSSNRVQLLQKKDDDVVITFAKRTAMGRAKRGQLKDVPVDELLHALFKVLVILLSSLCSVKPHSGSGDSRENQVKPSLSPTDCDMAHRQ
ncbi:hypothetical protein EDB89DRAFT_347352 [Lactarius sanguifluus]|nr:hypothetical protein EDB89DRAFT_347352 [Lactarius sanguifluus]